MSAGDQASAAASEVSMSSQPTPAPVASAQISVKGRSVSVPSVQIGGVTVVTTGKWLKIATVPSEELIEGETVTNPESFVSQLKGSGLKADLFTFAQRLPATTPRYGYHIEWENAAVIPITTFALWWKERTEYSIRKGVNRAKKLGVNVKIAEFNDQFVEAICVIYNETPVRQGKTFWHYQRDFQSVRHALATYLDRSIFIGAYHQDELIGFVKLTYVGAVATITQILSTKRHFDKRPNNALIAKAVEICELEGKSHFIYGDFVYYDQDSTLTEFKRRNGFEPVPLPRYYIPLTLRGEIAVRLGFHREFARQIPQPIFRQFLRVRRRWYASGLKIAIWR